jgi:NADH-quinone oxidoreductase subunit H
VIVAGSMNLNTIGQLQAGWFTNWYVFHDPFTFITFFIYFTCATASVNRAPFDLAEAESELVAGFHTEYSGIRWSYFFMAEYGSMFTVSGLAAILFFGGWNGPIPITDMLASALSASGSTFGTHPIFVYVANFLGMANFIFKAVVGVTVMMWLRWTLPRLRIDQVMEMCLKYCLPISCFTVVGVTFWQATFPGGLVPLDRVPVGEKLVDIRATVDAQWNAEHPVKKTESPAEKPEAEKHAPETPAKKHIEARLDHGPDSSLGSREAAEVAGLGQGD